MRDCRHFFLKIAVSRNAASNRRTRRPLAGRLRAPKLSYFVTPPAKSATNSLQDIQVRETVLTFRSSRTLNCDTVTTFYFFRRLQPYGKHERVILSSLSKAGGAKMQDSHYFFQKVAPLSQNAAANRRQPPHPPPLSR